MAGNRTIFFRRDLGSYEVRWDNLAGIRQHATVDEAYWRDFRRQWRGHGYEFVESDFQDPHDRR